MFWKKTRRKITAAAAKVVGQRARQVAARVLPFVVTPVAIGAGITAGGIYFFNRLALSVRHREEEGLWRFDQQGLHLALALRTPRRTAVMRLVSALAQPDTMTSIGFASMLGGLLIPRFRQRGMLLALALAGGGMLIGSIKYRYARVRPRLIEALAIEGTFSFPSGHSFISVVFYGLQAFWLMRRFSEPYQRALVGIGAVKLILLIGASRVYLGVHYPSDVLAGYAAALPWLATCLIANRQYELRSEEALRALPPPEPELEEKREKC